MPPSEEVKPAVVAKESGSVSADLAKGGGAKKSSDEKKAPEAVVEGTFLFFRFLHVLWVAINFGSVFFFLNSCIFIYLFI